MSGSGRPLGSGIEKEGSLERVRALTPAVQKKIIDALLAGSYLYVACEAAGLTYHGYQHWQKRWNDGDPATSIFDDFFNAVKEASSVAEVVALKDVRAGAPGWQGNAWFLERRYPKRWGRKDRAPDVAEKGENDGSEDAMKVIAKRGESKSSG